MADEPRRLISGVERSGSLDVGYSGHRRLSKSKLDAIRIRLKTERDPTGRYPNRFKHFVAYREELRRMNPGWHSWEPSTVAALSYPPLVDGASDEESLVGCPNSLLFLPREVPLKDAVIPSPALKTLTPSKSEFRDLELDDLENYRWAASHVELLETEPGDAPNSRAWGLLMFARSKQTTFEQILAQKLKVEGRDAEVQLLRDDGRALPLVEEHLSRFAELYPEFSELGHPDFTKEIWDRVGESVSGGEHDGTSN